MSTILFAATFVVVVLVLIGLASLVVGRLSPRTRGVVGGGAAVLAIGYVVVGFGYAVVTAGPPAGGGEDEPWCLGPPFLSSC